MYPHGVTSPLRWHVEVAGPEPLPMPTPFFVALLFQGLIPALTLQADPQLNSWLTTYSTKYARIYQTDAAKTAGTAITTWTNGTQNQSAPAYCGVQEVSV